MGEAQYVIINSRIIVLQGYPLVFYFFGQTKNHKGRRKGLKEESVLQAITQKEAKLLSLIKDVEFGEIKIIIQNGIPIRIEEIKKTIKI